MKKTKRQPTPTLLLRIEIENRCLVINTAIPTRWLVVATTLLGGLVWGWDTILKILDVISRLPR